MSLKHATPDHPIHELLSRRWSPYAFADRDVSAEDLRAIFEAARWAASSYNEQPWSFVVATRHEPDAFQRVLSCLVEGNQAWARHAPVLALGVARDTFSRNDRPNAAARHDLGLATGNLLTEATARDAGDPGTLPEGLRDRDSAPRTRRELAEFVFGERWGAASQLVR
jgi:nitroreductase